MRTKPRGELIFLLAAAGLVLAGVLVWEAGAWERGPSGGWHPPAIATSTRREPTGSGWWQSLPTAPPWPTARPSATPGATPTIEEWR